MKNEADIIRENFNKVVNINPENIKPAKDFVNNLNQKNSSLKNKHNSTIKNANSQNVLRDSGFFNFDFFEKKQNTEHFNISQDEIEKVFKLIDDKNRGEKITLNDLKKKMAIINSKFPNQEISTLTNGKNEIKATELYELLKDNELADFDPITEVYKILDINNENDIDLDHLQSLFEKLEMGKMDKKDKEILRECQDVDGDKKISLDDFKQLFNYLKEGSGPAGALEQKLYENCQI